MKKLFLTIVFLLVAVTAFAEDAPLNILQINPINMQGDTIYLLGRQDFGLGIGWNIASMLDQVIELRAETVFPIVGDGNSSTLLGAGIGLNLPRLVQLVGGTWLLPSITSSIGVLALYDFNAVDESDEIEPAVYLTIIKVTF